jgi:hypothetical protein
MPCGSQRLRGADKYAADTMTTAKTALKNAEDINTRKSDRKQTITFCARGGAVC